MRGSALLGRIHPPEILYPPCRKRLDLPPPVGILFLKFLQKPNAERLFRRPGTGRRVQASPPAALLLQGAGGAMMMRSAARRDQLGISIQELLMVMAILSMFIISIDRKSVV